MLSGSLQTALIGCNVLLAVVTLSCAPSEAASAQTYSLYSNYLPSDSLASKAQATLKQSKHIDTDVEKHKKKAEFASPVDGYFIQVSLAWQAAALIMSTYSDRCISCNGRSERHVACPLLASTKTSVL